MLRGELVGLVPLQTTDELALYRWLNDPRVRAKAGRPEWRAAYSLEQVQDIIQERLARQSDLDLVVVDLKGEGELGLVGLSQLMPMRDSAQLYLIWGEREGDPTLEALALAVVYAFNSQGLHRLWTRVPAIEMERIVLFERVGFKKEGVLREDHFSGGGWRDSVLLSMLSAEARPC